jgi:3-oxoacyl-[acyl-carrier protein] reductase
MASYPSLKNKSAIVTGASRGIGRAIALRLAQDGANVIVNYASRSAEAAEVVGMIEKMGAKARAVRGDVSETADLKRVFDEAVGEFGGVDILVNNAGAILYKTVAETTDAEFDRLFAVNVRGTFLACREAAQRMNGMGRIINFSSSATAMMAPTYGPYVATKGAVEQLTRILAKELGAKKICVNAVSPGPTETELFLAGKSADELERRAQMAALGRLGKPQDMAEVVAFLASEESGWITGQNIRANGGMA